MCSVGNIVPGGSSTRRSLGVVKLATPPSRRLEPRLAAELLLQLAVVVAAVGIAHARAVERLPAAEAYVVAQIAAFLQGADEGQTLARQPAVAGEPPLDHEPAPHLENGLPIAVWSASDRR